MNTTPKTTDLIKRNIPYVLVMAVGLALGYGFGASRAQYAVVYAPAPAVAPAVAAISPSPSVQMTSAASVLAARQAVAAASFAEAPVRPSLPQPVAAAPVRPSPSQPVAAAKAPVLANRGQKVDLTAHEKTAAFIEKAPDVVAHTPAPAAAAQPVAQAASTAPRAIAEGGAIRYGAASRSEIMGRGAGPVYNFQGAAAGESNGAAGVGQAVGATLKNATQVLDDTQNALNGAPLSPEMRQQIETQINLGKSAINQTPSTGQ